MTYFIINYGCKILHIIVDSFNNLRSAYFLFELKANLYIDFEPNLVSSFVIEDYLRNDIDVIFQRAKALLCVPRTEPG